MKPLFLIAALILGVSGPASAQEQISSGRTSALYPEEAGLAGSDAACEDVSLETLPRSLGEPSDVPPLAMPESQPFSLGAAAGYLNAKGADRGTWTGGVQARLRLGYFAAEASIQFHENEYEHGDVVVSQYPVQLTAFLYIIPEGPIRPYILGGVGWYYTRFDYSGQFASTPNRTEHIFGEHLGAGAELFISPGVSLDADVRYIFLNPTTDQVIGRDFNYWQITAGVNFFF